MTPFILVPTNTTPLVWLDPLAGKCHITGRSLPENAPEFYGKLTEAIDAALPMITSPVRWEFRLPYFNTSSTKGLYQVLARIRSHADVGGQHEVVWDVEDQDEFMREAGENFEELLDLGIIFRELSEEQAEQEDRRLMAAFAQLHE
jgi:hypothetical protein